MNEKNKSSNYLNFFENKLIYNIPCSMSCLESIEIWKKVYKIWALYKGKSVENNFLKEKTYIVFEDLQWFKIEDDKYSFWWLVKEKNTRIIGKIKKWYKIKIISDNEIILYNEANDVINIGNIIIFNFV